MVDHILRRNSLASMLSEALCSRAKRVSEMWSLRSKQIVGSDASSPLIFPQLSIIPEELKGPTTVSLLSVLLVSPILRFFFLTIPLPDLEAEAEAEAEILLLGLKLDIFKNQETELDPETRIETNEIPFAFRAKQAGRVFRRKIRWSV